MHTREEVVFYLCHFTLKNLNQNTFPVCDVKDTCRSFLVQNLGVCLGRKKPTQTHKKPTHTDKTPNKTPCSKKQKLKNPTSLKSWSLMKLLKLKQRTKKTKESLLTFSKA